MARFVENVVMNKIELISVPVTDQQKAKDFYVNVLGFSILMEGPFGNNQMWIQLGLPGTETSIALVNWFEKMTPGCLQGLIIETADIELERQRLLAKGVTVGDIRVEPWGKFLQLEDGDGNQWSFHQK